MVIKTYMFNSRHSKNGLQQLHDKGQYKHGSQYFPHFSTYSYLERDQ